LTLSQGDCFGSIAAFEEGREGWPAVAAEGIGHYFQRKQQKLGVGKVTWTEPLDKVLPVVYTICIASDF
jgi:hypothetical protein